MMCKRIRPSYAGPPYDKETQVLCYPGSTKESITCMAPLLASTSVLSTADRPPFASVRITLSPLRLVVNSPPFMVLTVNLPPQALMAAVIFLDIRGFTPFAEQRSPEEIIQYQNQVFQFMMDTVEDCHGNINQFMGDGFMPTFEAPESHRNDDQNAVDSATRILRELSDRSKSGQLDETRIGIGLDYG